MELRLNQYRNHPVIKKYVIPILRPCRNVFCRGKNLVFSQLGKRETILNWLTPLWLLQTFPAIQETRKLLGKKAYHHLISIALTKPYRNAMYEMAVFLCNAGLPDEGIAMHAALLNDYKASEIPPEVQIVTYLQMLLFGSPDIQTNEHIYKEHVRWSKRFISGQPYTTYTNSLTLNRRLKIGYTCHFITSSTAKTSLQPLLKSHHNERVEVYMYSDEPPHTVPNTIKNSIAHWRDTYGMTADAFCELVRKDEIDILLELNGHGVFHRYHEITRHPVPIQVAWYNYACTTGVQGMDYTLASDDNEIEHLQPYYSETIFRKTGVGFAIPIGTYFPPVSTSPFEKNGHITFCSFGQAIKVSREQILLWCEVLKRVPNSKFFMKAQVLAEPANRAAYIHHFQDGGIEESRLIMEGNSDYPTLLRCYERADIALDTYPHNAGTTSIESMMQGVPVISLIGDRYSSQNARSTVGAAGHPEFLAKSPQEFIEKAVALANNHEQLKHYRQHLRDDYKRSPRANVDGFMTELEDTFFKMWEHYITKQKNQNKGQTHELLHQ